MAKSLTIKETLDDAMRSVYIADFSGGLNSEDDPQDLPLNASPDCQNVKILKGGRLIGRDGYVVRVASLPANPDGAGFFYDSSGNRRVVVFTDGALYDCTSGAANLIQSACYTAGNRVSAVSLNNSLYFSDGETITTVGSDDSGIWYWDPIGSPLAATLLVSSGSPATIETPAAKVLTTYAGSLVLARIKYVNGTYAKHAVMWTNVNDPTTLVGTNIFQVGQGQGGDINCVVPMAVSAQGVSPYSALFVGKSKFGVYHLKGALSVSTLSEVMINASTGVLDGATVQFVPGPDAAAYIVWLGTDYKVWYSSGVTSGELSQPIRTELAQYLTDRASSNPNDPITSVRHFESFQYILDCGGGRQYCFDWDRKVWTRYSGWPSGHWIEAKDGNGRSVIYCADVSNARLAQCDVGITDNGTAIDPYWKTGFLNAGDPDLWKIWQNLFVAFMTDTGDVTITATVNLGEGAQATGTMTITPATDLDARWDVAEWDEADWVAGGFGVYTPYKKRKRLTREVANTGGTAELLGGYDLQLRVGQSVPGARFEILGINVLYLPRGRKRVVA